MESLQRKSCKIESATKYMFFSRELPNPLCTYQLYQSFVNAVQGCSTAIRNSETDHERLLKMREAVQKLPPPHYRTLEYLMRHLARVAKHGSSTGMTTRNVAIVWAPNLLRCEALEVGGVAALQGVGVQAVVTEFLICYADLIFCDHLPNLDHPVLGTEHSLLTKKCRPNSLAISTPTKLITLEEARSKHFPNKTEECNYIEVGGGPKNLPKKYHTIIELPSGIELDCFFFFFTLNLQTANIVQESEGIQKRSPLGWRLFFTKSRNNSQSNLTKTRKASTPITINEKSVTESDLTDMKRKLRTVKSAESLISGHSEPASTEDVLGPLHSLNKPTGHNRSVSHDSYFDTLQNSQNNSEGSLLDLSEIQLNFELEESEMRIFSEDESLVSSPRIHKEYIDCSTPDNIVSTTAVIHPLPESPVVQEKHLFNESYQPKNKSPRNSENLDKRQSLNLETTKTKTVIPKSFTEMDLSRKYLGPNSILTTPTPGSPGYKQLGESSANTTPGISPTYDSSPTESTFLHTSKNEDPFTKNVILNPEKVVIPTSTASLPIQEASQPSLSEHGEFLLSQTDERPKSLSAIEDLNSSKDSTIKANLSSSYFSAPYHCIENSEHLSPTDLSLNEVVESSTENLTTSHTSLSFPISPSKNSLSPNVSPTQVYDYSSQDLLTPTSVLWNLLLRRTQAQVGLVQITTKRKSDETESLDDNAIYQQVKYFRRSIHEVNALLDLENGVSTSQKDDEISENVTRRSDSLETKDECSDNSETNSEGAEKTKEESKGQIERLEENYDSLEADNTHVYENIEGDSLRGEIMCENIELNNEKTDKVVETVKKVQPTEEMIHVRDLTSRFEGKEPVAVNVTKNSVPSANTVLQLDVGKVESNLTDDSTNGNNNYRLKKVSTKKDSLPPCLRARNLKHQLKTRSLDEEEFNNEFSLTLNERRKSLDESLGYKTNSLPKTLNQPKSLPENDSKVDFIHLAHSTENINNGLNEEEEQKKRERIERYKEERRRILQDKYRKSARSDESVDIASDSLEEDPPQLKQTHKAVNAIVSKEIASHVENILKKETKPMKESLKSRAAIFEQNNQRISAPADLRVSKNRSSFREQTKQTDMNYAKNLQGTREKMYGRIDKKENFEDFKDLDFIRNKRRDDDLPKEERRRHTFDSRERETESERLRRISLENRSPNFTLLGSLNGSCLGKTSLIPIIGNVSSLKE
ncbi:hypothetical protein NQ314_002042 [Rhamnusium bicolor]|uniref:Rho-GAP domain-containing protein n=1 Tax=Rhamnusium bicolor TaxID=1586634 RepID=A0AAV8ZR31_9CUCU|nr:hypothetical protein NQ314_002042 [Rhamnusium bicolor]